MNNLAQRMDAGVGSAGTMSAHLFVADARHCFLQFALYRTVRAAKLDLPAAKVCAVVG